MKMTNVIFLTLSVHKYFPYIKSILNAKNQISPVAHGVHCSGQMFLVTYLHRERVFISLMHAVHSSGHAPHGAAMCWAGAELIERLLA